MSCRSPELRRLFGAYLSFRTAAPPNFTDKLISCCYGSWFGPPVDRKLGVPTRAPTATSRPIPGRIREALRAFAHPGIPNFRASSKDATYEQEIDVIEPNEIFECMLAFYNLVNNTWKRVLESLVYSPTSRYIEGLVRRRIWRSSPHSHTVFTTTGSFPALWLQRLTELIYYCTSLTSYYGRGIDLKVETASITGRTWAPYSLCRYRPLYATHLFVKAHGHNMVAAISFPWFHLTKHSLSTVAG